MTMIIIWNLAELVRKTNVNENFLSNLVEEGLLTSKDIQRCKERKKGSKFTYAIFQAIKEDERVVDKLVNVLLKSGNVESARVLSPLKAERYEKHRDSKQTVEPSLHCEDRLCLDGCVSSKQFLKQSPNEKILEVKVIPANMDNYISSKEQNIYHIGPGLLRGHVLIINNEQFQECAPRRGSQMDVKNLTNLFDQLGFRVEIEKNLNRSDTLKAVLNFSSKSAHETANMAAVVVLSHGERGRKIITNDNLVVDIEDDILRHFNNQNCPHLHGKPKFFIFQACQGEKLDEGVESRGLWTKTEVDAKPFPSSPPGSPSKDPSWEDMVIAFATIPGYVAWRNPIRGSWFIETLCQVFMQESCKTPLRDMLDQVAEVLKTKESSQGCKQTPSYEVRGFTKKLFFYPQLDI